MGKKTTPKKAETKTALIMRMYDKGQTCAAISKETGILYQQVYNTIQRVKASRANVTVTSKKKAA